MLVPKGGRDRLMAVRSVFQELDIPLVRTSMVECLTSYVSRLARAHSVTPGVLHHREVMKYGAARRKHVRLWNQSSIAFLHLRHQCHRRCCQRLCLGDREDERERPPFNTSPCFPRSRSFHCTCLCVAWPRAVPFVWSVGNRPVSRSACLCFGRWKWSSSARFAGARCD